MSEEAIALGKFRSSVRTWLAENLPPSVRANPMAVSMALVDGAPLPEDVRVWRERMGAVGWGVPTWPRPYGGGGLTTAQTRILQEEMSTIGARNPIGGLGVMMFGPTLLEYGSHDQLAQHIPPIARGELRWCQGFSEPGSGSDLASLQMAAEDCGDYFQVSGQKVWTTGGQYADWCFCLVRTARTAKKHDGISFVLIDMLAPGVEVRPIQLISGVSPFCEIFFTDVRVPKSQLVGPLNGGWSVAKRLLQHERQATSAGVSPLGVASTAHLGELAKTYAGVSEAGRLNDPDLRRRLTAHLMDARAVALTRTRAEAENSSNSNPSNVSSILKNAGSRVAQTRAELTVEIMGLQGLGWVGDGFADSELAAVRTLLMGKAGSIAGGSEEIQNNIIAKRILGLPDPAGSIQT